MKDKNLYIIIGAQRCGTTYLYNLLDEHPDICMAKPMKPEPKFFLSETFEKGEAFYYRKYFAHKESHHKVFIEKSTSYYEYEIVPKRLSKNFPNAKLIFVLRDPTERAISNYFFSKNNKLETRTIEDVFLYKKLEPEYLKEISTNPFNYIKRGEYIRYINMYLRFIPKENLKILFYADLINDVSNIQSFYNYLSVNDNFIPPSYRNVINKSYVDQVVSCEIINELDLYYKPFNDKLELFLGRKPFKQK